MRRLFAVGLWLATTATATGMAWTATSAVARDVTDRPAPVVAHRDVVIALATGSPPIATTVAPAPTSTLRSLANPRPGPLKAPSTPATGPPTTRPPAAARPPSQVQLPGAPPAAGPTTVPRQVTTVTSQAAPATATYSVTGGVVTVACTGSWTIRMVSARPDDGYQIDSGGVNQGPFQVEVHFRPVQGGDDTSVKAACIFGQPVRTDGQSQPGRAVPGQAG